MKKFASLFTAMTVLAASFAAAEGNVPSEANAEVKERDQQIIENKEEEMADNTAISSEAVGAGEAAEGQTYENNAEVGPAEAVPAGEEPAEEAATATDEETPEEEAAPEAEAAAEEVTPAEGEEQAAPAAEAEERTLRLEKFAFTEQSLKAAPGETVVLTLDMKVDEPDDTVLQPMTIHVDLGEAQSYQVLYASPALALSGGSKGLYVKLPESTVKEGRIILPSVTVKNADGTTDTAPAGELRLVLQVIPFAEEDARSRAAVLLELIDEDGLYKHYHGPRAAYISKEAIEEAIEETTEEAPAQETQDGAASDVEKEPEDGTEAASEEEPVTQPEEAAGETEETAPEAVADGEGEMEPDEIPTEEAEGEPEAVGEEQPVTVPGENMPENPVEGEMTPEETPAEEATEETKQAAGEDEETTPEVPAGEESENTPEETPAEEATEETEQAAGEDEEITPEASAEGEGETALEEIPAEEPEAPAEEEGGNVPVPEEAPAADFDPAKVKLMCHMNIPSAEVKVGDTWQLTVVTEGLENVLWTLQWEYSTDGEHWQIAEGETGDTLTVLIDETNFGTLWRYTINVVVVK